ncbi:MAG: hypothetical protein IKO27_07615 [Ruminococcus sp.]|nr:hypothetical protein [Ruminococcus sp.]
MPDDYNDILYLFRPQYDDLPQMSAADRAAQFSPFAALVGYGEAVDETARLTDRKLELCEDEANELNAALGRLLKIISEQPEISVTYFIPDGRKSGGRYVTKTGRPRIFDSYTRELVFTDGTRIAVDDMMTLSIEGEPPADDLF